MRSRTIHRAATLAVLLVLVVSTAATADTVTADGDTITPGLQTSAFLGEVAPGAVINVDVPFTLTCQYPSHVTPGSVIAVIPDSTAAPAGGSIDATAGSIGPVPSDWPASGSSCPGTGTPTLESTTPSHVTLTAPDLAGTGYQYAILYVRNPEDGLSSITAVTFTLDVAGSAADTTPPVLSGVPGDIDAETDDPAGAVVTWPAPTAVDDTDPAPVVGCVPASGSLFPVGTTAVTCTATDASGNVADATFNVTVRRHVPTLQVQWAPPLDADATLTVGPEGRTVPVAVTVEVDAQAWTPESGPSPGLRLDRMSSCDPSATVAASGPAAAMDWQGGHWASQLDSRPLTAGCWHLTVVVDGFDAGSAGLRVDGGPRGLALSAAQSGRNH